MTENLWGVGSTAPYMHDGRATTLAEAILEHGTGASNDTSEAPLRARQLSQPLDFRQTRVDRVSRESRPLQGRGGRGGRRRGDIRRAQSDASARVAADRENRAERLQDPASVSARLQEGRQSRRFSCLPTGSRGSGWSGGAGQRGNRPGRIIQRLRKSLKERHADPRSTADPFAFLVDGAGRGRADDCGRDANGFFSSARRRGACRVDQRPLAHRRHGLDLRQGGPPPRTRRIWRHS